MKDTYTETSHMTYREGIKNSLIAIPIGIILFIASFVLLWWNEGNSVRLLNASDFINKNAIPVTSNHINHANDTKLIATNGSAYTDETLSDSMVTVKDALRLIRTVEMYQWVEKERSGERRTFGGSTTKTVTYSYEKKWDKIEHNSDNFRQSGYNNPKFVIRSKSVDATKARFGDFILNDDQISRISNYRNIDVLSPLQGYSIIDNYYYKGKNYSMPEIGDIRISYKYVPNGSNISIIGQQYENNTLGEMFTKNGALYIQYDGTYTLNEMLEKFKQSNALHTYILRFVGFLIMLLGLKLLTNPILMIARYIPFLSDIADVFSFGMVMVIALILSLLTISIAWLAYRPIISLVLLILIVVIVNSIKKHVQNRKYQISNQV